VRSAAEVTIPDDTFLTYITDPDPSIANVTRAAYETTEGECLQYIELGPTSSHYSINDWNLATAPHQVCVSTNSLFSVFQLTNLAQMETNI